MLMCACVCVCFPPKQSKAIKKRAEPSKMIKIDVKICMFVPC